MPSASSPASRMSCVRCAASASSISALLGMQPTWRQTPPSPAGARALDERHLAAELGRADGGGVAAGPSAEDEQVDGVGELADDHQRRSSKSSTGSSSSFCS